MKRILLIIICFQFLGITVSKAQLMGLKTDAVKDLLWIPNFGADFATSSNTSLGVEIFGSKYCWGKKVSTFGIAPEFRYWFSGRTFNSFFLGAGVQAVHYNIDWNRENREGEAIGAGLTFGYDMYMTSNWVIDFHAGLGPMFYRHQHTWEGDVVSNKRFTEQGCSITPFLAGVSIIYIIK